MKWLELIIESILVGSNITFNRLLSPSSVISLYCRPNCLRLVFVFNAQNLWTRKEFGDYNQNFDFLVWFSCIISKLQKKSHRYFLSNISRKDMAIDSRRIANNANEGTILVCTIWAPLNNLKRWIMTTFFAFSCYML